MMLRRWRSVDVPLYPWVRSVERILIAERLLPMAGSLVNIFTDYAGEQKGASYQTVGLLYADLYGSRSWELARRAVRERFLSDGRRLSFKNLGDRWRRAALIPFLEATEGIEGLCVVMAVKRSISRLCVDETFSQDVRERLQLQKAWSRKDLERMARVTHLIGLLMGGLTNEGQSVYWISDRDSLFANEVATKDARALLSLFSSHYAAVCNVREI